jgi:hypothetical protein
MAASVALKDKYVAAAGTPGTAVGGTPGSTHVGYKIVGVAADGGLTAASAEGLATTANATLTAGNKVTVTWVDPANAVRILVYRTTAAGTSPTTTGLIASLAVGVQTLDDTGLAADGTTPSANNTTGTARGGQNFVACLSFKPGRTVAMYVNGQYAGVQTTGPFGLQPAVGQFGSAAYGGANGDLNVPNADRMAAGVNQPVVAIDSTDGTSATTTITTT